MNLRRHTACSTFAFACALAVAPSLVGCFSSRYEVVREGAGAGGQEMNKVTARLYSRGRIGPLWEKLSP